MNNYKYKIAIVWANPYNKNLGVSALGYSALSLISDVISENNIDAELTFLGSSKSTPDSLVIKEKTIPFFNIIGLTYASTASRLKLALLPSRYNLKALKNFDRVFDVSEGDSFSDIYGKARFKRIIGSKLLFNRLKTRQVLLPQTIGPFSEPENEVAGFNAMKQMDNIICRDAQSFSYASKFLRPDQVTESIDLAFYLPYEKRQFEPGVHVGINVSGLLWNGGYTKDNQFNMQSDYRTLIKNCIEYFLSLKDVTVHLVPHVIPTDFAVEDDYAVSNNLQATYPDVKVAPRFTSPIDAKSYISGLTFFTGARMHACIAAFSTGIPVVPMAYSRKFNGLFIDTLQYPWLGDCVNNNETVVLNNIIEGYKNISELKKQIGVSHETIIKPRLKKLKQIISDALSQ